MFQNAQFPFLVIHYPYNRNSRRLRAVQKEYANSKEDRVHEMGSTPCGDNDATGFTSMEEEELRSTENGETEKRGFEVLKSILQLLKGVVGRFVIRFLSNATFS